MDTTATETETILRKIMAKRAENNQNTASIANISDVGTVQDVANVWRSLLGWLVALFVFILPWKFGAPFNSSELPNFPMTGYEWLFFTIWPPALATTVVGFLGIFSLLAYPIPKIKYSYIVPVLQFCAVAAGLLGLCHTTEWQYANQWLIFHATLSVFACTLWRVSQQDKKFFPLLLNSLAASTVLTLLHGAYQHFFGLQENLELMLENAAKGNIQLNDHLLAKLQQTRISGVFGDPNVFAAHLLLTFPPTLYALNRWSDKIEPRKITKILFLTIGTLLFCGCLFWSGSRGAMLGLAVAIAVAVWQLPMQRKWRLGLLGAALILGLLMLIGVTLASNRNLLTASVRLQYYQTATRIFLDNPVCGGGLGEFFPWHSRLKPFVSEEVRDPHSFFFALTGQCGIFGLLTAMAQLLLPLLLAMGCFRRQQNDDNRLRTATLAAWCGWTIHSLVQFNDTIPATCLLCSLVALLAFSQEKQNIKQSSLLTVRCCAAAIMLGLTILHACTFLTQEYKIEAADRMFQKFKNGKVLTKMSAEKLVADIRQLCPLSASQRHYYAFSLQGQICQMLRDYKGECQVYSRMIEVFPHRSSAYCRLASACILAADFPAAKTALAQSREWYPANPRAIYLQALLDTTPKSTETYLKLLNSAQELTYSNGDNYCLYLTPADKKLPEFNQKLLDDLNATKQKLPDGHTVTFQYKPETDSELP